MLGDAMVKIVAYNGRAIRPRMVRDRRPSPLPLVFDLRGMRGLGGGRRILLEHDHGRPVGYADRTWLVKGFRLMVSGLLRRRLEAARQVIEEAEAGREWQASISADILQSEDLEEGTIEFVNARFVSGPCRIARTWTLGEVSICRRGADAKSRVEIVGLGCNVAG